MEMFRSVLPEELHQTKHFLRKKKMFFFLYFKIVGMLFKEVMKEELIPISSISFVLCLMIIVNKTS